MKRIRGIFGKRKKGNTVPEYAIMLTVLALSIVALGYAAPHINPLYKRTNDMVRAANHATFDPKHVINDKPNEFGAIVVLSPGPAIPPGSLLPTPSDTETPPPPQNTPDDPIIVADNPTSPGGTQEPTPTNPETDTPENTNPEDGQNPTPTEPVEIPPITHETPNTPNEDTQTPPPEETQPTDTQPPDEENTEPIEPQTPTNPDQPTDPTVVGGGVESDGDSGTTPPTETYPPTTSEIPPSEPPETTPTSPPVEAETTPIPPEPTPQPSPVDPTPAPPPVVPETTPPPVDPIPATPPVIPEPTPTPPPATPNPTDTNGNGKPKNGNNGHGNDQDGCDASNPGNKPGCELDMTDDDGLPGGGNKKPPLESLPPNHSVFACFDEGMLAAGTTTMPRFNTFSNGYCLHGKTLSNTKKATLHHASVTQSPTQHIVHAPNPEMGLLDAITLTEHGIDIYDSLLRTGQDLLTPNNLGRPSYLNATASAIELPTRNPNANHFQQGRVHTHTCNSNQTLTLPKNIVLTNIAIVTNCKISISEDARLENVVIFTNSTRSDSLVVREGITAGKLDNCAKGGNVHLLTLGSASIQSKAVLSGAFIVANGNITLNTQTSLIGSLLMTSNSITVPPPILLPCGSAVVVQQTWWQSLRSQFGI